MPRNRIMSPTKGKTTSSSATTKKLAKAKIAKAKLQARSKPDDQ